MTIKNKKYWSNLEQIALKEGDLEYALYCQEQKIKAPYFNIKKIK